MKHVLESVQGFFSVVINRNYINKTLQEDREPVTFETDVWIDPNGVWRQYCSFFVTVLADSCCFLVTYDNKRVHLSDSSRGLLCFDTV